MLHCGYTVEVTPVIDELRPFLGDLSVKNEFYTAVYYKGDVRMDGWFIKAKPVDGYITGLYCSKKDAVCIITVQNLNLYLIIAHGSNIKPFEMKKCANNGQLGSLIQLPNKLKVRCIPKSY